MTEPAPRYHFSTRDLLTMAVLAGMGAAASVLVGQVGRALMGLTGRAGGLQFLAGLHVLWPVLAAVLVRRAGAAACTGLLKGAAEMLAGSSHGLLVVAVSAVSGLIVDGTVLVAGGRRGPIALAVAGALAAGSNVPLFQFFASAPRHRMVFGVVVGLSCVAAASGAVLGGLLGWSLGGALERLGLAGPAGGSSPAAGQSKDRQ